MGVSIRVSDYDLTKGIPEYNLSARPVPSITGGSGLDYWWTGSAAASPSKRFDGLSTVINKVLTPAPYNGVGSWVASGNTVISDNTMNRRPGVPSWKFTHTQTSPTLGGSFRTTGTRMPVESNATVSVSMYVRPVSPGIRIMYNIEMYGATGTLLGTLQRKGYTSYPQNEWTYTSDSYVVWAGTTSIRISIYDDHTSGSPLGQVFYVSDVMVNDGPVPLDYFDGSFTPTVTGGAPNWRMSLTNGTATATHSVVKAQNLLATTGVAPRRGGNTYAVTTLTGAGTGTVVQSPDDFVRVIPQNTLTYTQYFYVKSAASTALRGGGNGWYDENFNNMGGGGDSPSVPFPTNQWVRLTWTEETGSGTYSYLRLILSAGTSGLSAGDIIISTDAMYTYASGNPTYFDGDFADDLYTKYEWTDLPRNSTSTRTVRVPSTVLLFDPDNIIDYSVSEEAMSPNPADYSGGYGAINFSLLENPDTKLLRGKTFELEDNVKGKTTGIVTAMSRSEEGVSVTTDSMIGVLNAWRRLEPFSGNLQGLINYVFGEVDLRLPVRFENNLNNRTVVSRGYVGNLWDWIKELLSAQQIEMSLVYNTVVFRPYRTYEAYLDRATDFGWDIAQGETARAVEVTYYSSVYNFNEFYPVSYDDPDYSPTIMQVDSGETVEYVLQLSATPTSPITEFNQPFAVASVTNAPQPSSRYVVSGSDDLPIQPAQWNNNGGSLRVRVSEDDPSQIIVTLTGANVPNLAPFRIAMSSGSGNYYNSLHLVGPAVRYVPNIVRIPTGASIDTTGTDVGVTVQNPFVQTKAQAFDLGIKVAAGFSGGISTIHGSAWDINRRGYTGGVYAQIADFNDSWGPSDTIADFNARYAGFLIAQFNTAWEELVLDEFPVQAFGNAAGARVRGDDAYYRITEATFGPGPMDYVAEMDTLVGDFNAMWVDATIEQFNLEFFGKLIRDFSTIPLRREE